MAYVANGDLTALGCICVRPRNAQRLHRPLGLSEIPPLHSSRTPGPNRGETAPKPLICIGVGTEAAERICSAAEAGPTEARYKRGLIKP